MIINKKAIEATWHDLNKEVKIKIQPFKSSQATTMNIGALLKEQYMYSLVDWDGIFDEDGTTKLPVNDENKEFLYDYYGDIRNFVLSNSYIDTDKKAKKAKN